MVRSTRGKWGEILILNKWELNEQLLLTSTEVMFKALLFEYHLAKELVKKQNKTNKKQFLDIF